MVGEWWKRRSYLEIYLQTDQLYWLVSHTNQICKEKRNHKNIKTSSVLQRSSQIKYMAEWKDMHISSIPSEHITVLFPE